MDTLIEPLGQLVEGEVAGGEQFKPELDEGGTFGVDDDGADVTAVGAVDMVEVTKRGAADGAARFVGRSGPNRFQLPPAIRHPVDQ